MTRRKEGGGGRRGREGEREREAERVCVCVCAHALIACSCVERMRKKNVIVWFWGLCFIELNNSSVSNH
jgi:hypothetical protein